MPEDSRKIMILGAGNHQLHLIRKAREMGLHTVVISPPGDYPGLAEADKVYDLDVRAAEEIAEIGRREGISGVVSDQGDVFVKPQAYVAEKLGLPGIGTEAAALFTDKAAMRRKSMELGLPTIKSTLTESLAEAEAFLRELGAPAIIKPINNGGSRGVSRVSTIEELREKYPTAAGFSGTGKVIIEQFIDGREYEVDSLVVNGECRYMMTADLTEFRLPDVFACTTILFPADTDAETEKRLIELNRKTIEGFGLRQGLSHAEYIEDRHTGELYLMEAAARGGGLYISSHVAGLQTGLDTAELLIRLALGELTQMPDFPRELCHCGYVSCYLPVGEIISMDGIEEAKSLPFVTKWLIRAKEGMHTGQYTDKGLRNVFFLRADSREELNEHIEQIRNTVRVKVRTAAGIEGPIWH